MKDPMELLEMKEAEIERVKREIAALKAVTPLLEESDALPEEPGNGFTRFS